MERRRVKWARTLTPELSGAPHYSARGFRWGRGGMAAGWLEEDACSIHGAEVRTVQKVPPGRADQGKSQLVQPEPGEPSPEKVAFSSGVFFFCFYYLPGIFTWKPKTYFVLPGGVGPLGPPASIPPHPSPPGLAFGHGSALPGWMGHCGSALAVRNHPSAPALPEEKEASTHLFLTYV